MLYEKGLLQAFAKVKSNKRSSGVDGQTIEDFAEHLSEEVALLADTHLLRNFEGRIDMSRIRGPYVRFCERDGVSQNVLTSPYSIMSGYSGLRSFLLIFDRSELLTQLVRHPLYRAYSLQTSETLVPVSSLTPVWCGSRRRGSIP